MNEQIIQTLRGALDLLPTMRAGSGREANQAEYDCRKMLESAITFLEAQTVRRPLILSIEQRDTILTTGAPLEHSLKTANGLISPEWMKWFEDLEAQTVPAPTKVSDLERPRGLTVRDASGNVVLLSGVPLQISYGPLCRPITKDDVERWSAGTTGIDAADADDDDPFIAAQSFLDLPFFQEYFARNAATQSTTAPSDAQEESSNHQETTMNQSFNYDAVANVRHHIAAAIRYMETPYGSAIEPTFTHAERFPDLYRALHTALIDASKTSQQPAKETM
jgi:hypothetical protein